MERLGRTELRGVLALLAALGQTDGIDAFAEVLTTGIRDLVPCDLASYNEVDGARGHVLFRCDPVEAVFPGAEERFAEHLAEHPLVQYYRRTGEGPALKLSDFLTLRQFHATGLYAEVFQPTATNHLLSVNFDTAPSGGMVALALHRARPDFSERHRVLLDLLRPHLTTAYRATEARQLLNQTALVLHADGRHVVLVDPSGAMRHATPGAQECLARHFGLVGIRGVLPAPVRSLATSAASEALVTPTPAGTLLARVLARSRTRVALLLQESPAAGADGDLAALGLTPREAQVLRLVAEGQTNAQVAVQLGISGLTVKSHLEHIYDKLGVHTRTAAAALFRGRCDPIASSVVPEFRHNTRSNRRSGAAAAGGERLHEGGDRLGAPLPRRAHHR